MTKQATIAIAVLALSGCSAFVIPPKQLESNEASIRSAEELGAASVPKARLHLEMAKDQTVDAKRLAAAGDDRATLVLERAQSDAELALSIAREASVHADAVAAADQLQLVRERGENK
jgi:hypothetical protein